MTSTVNDTSDRMHIEREFRADCPVSEIRPHPKNAREHDRDDIREGLTNNPQYKPVVVQKSTGHILAGNGTYLVATEELGWPHIDALFVDVDDERALVILAGDNKIGSRSGYHNDALAKLLAEIAEDQGGLDGTGYNMDELDDLLAELAESGAQALDDLPGQQGAAAVLDEVPATNAAYAETDDETEARQEKVATQVPHHAKGLAEVMLVFTEADRTEFGNLVSAAREVLGKNLKSSDVVLRATRVLLAALDARHDPKPIDMATLLKGADYDVAAEGTSHEDPALNDAMITPLGDRKPSVPTIMSGPDDVIGKARHITFSSADEAEDGPEGGGE